MVSHTEGALKARLRGVRQREMANVMQEARGDQQTQIRWRKPEPGADLKPEPGDADRVIEATRCAHATWVEVKRSEKADPPEPRQPR